MTEQPIVTDDELYYQNVDVNEKHDNGNRTPLHDAIHYHCNAKIISLLLTRGANPNARNSKGCTPLHNAIHYHCNAEIIALLLTSGADPNARNSKGYTPLHYAIIKKYSIEIIALLLNHGADPNIKTVDGYSLLHNATAHYNNELVTLLLEHGADPNVQNYCKNTPLHYAVNEVYDEHTFTINLKLIQLLLKHGANINIQNTYGYSPLELAESNIGFIAQFPEHQKNVIQLFHTYKRNLFRLVCKGLKSHNLGLNSLLLIGQHMKLLPDKDLSDIVLKCLC